MNQTQAGAYGTELDHLPNTFLTMLKFSLRLSVAGKALERERTADLRGQNMDMFEGF